MPAPAPLSTSTSWPWATYSRTEPGVSPTRYSWFLISLGQPTRIDDLLADRLVQPDGPHMLPIRPYSGSNVFAKAIVDEPRFSCILARKPLWFEESANNGPRQDRYR